MRIRLGCDREGSGGFQEAGATIDLPEDEARRLIADRQATPVSQSIETASVVPPQNASSPKPRPKRERRG